MPLARGGIICGSSRPDPPRGASVAFRHGRRRSHPDEFREALGAYADRGDRGHRDRAARPLGRHRQRGHLPLARPADDARLPRPRLAHARPRSAPQGRFGVNALAAGQEELARRFSGKDPEPEKWEGVEWSESGGLPRLAERLLWVACELRDLIDGGDHLILTGNVLEAESRDGQPLLFHRGDYRDLLAES